MLPFEHSKGLPNQPLYHPTPSYFLFFSLSFPFSFCNFPPGRQNTFLPIDLIQKIRVKICSVSTTQTPPDLIKFLEQPSFSFWYWPRAKTIYVLVWKSMISFLIYGQSPLGALKYIGVHMLRKLEWFWDFEKTYFVSLEPTNQRQSFRTLKTMSFLDWTCHLLWTALLRRPNLLPCLFLLKSMLFVNSLCLSNSVRPFKEMSREKMPWLMIPFFVAGCICKSWFFNTDFLSSCTFQIRRVSCLVCTQSC